MNAIAWEMRYGLPNSRYLEFVSQWRLALSFGMQSWDKAGQYLGRDGLGDPFAVQISSQAQADLYVIRSNIEAELSRPGLTIVLGSRGSGKTTLLHCYGPKSRRRDARDRSLVVRLALNQPSSADSFSGRPRYLSYSMLAAEIFDSFWTSLMQDAVRRRATYHVHLREDKPWRTKLHWFFQHLTPREPYICDEFELMAWLRSSLDHSPFAGTMTPDALLRQLVHFVTTPYQIGMDKYNLGAAYSRIEVLIDFGISAAAAALRDLLAEIEALCRLNLGRFEFKVFLDSAWKDVVEQLSCVEEGRLALYELPRWTEAELIELLRARLPGSPAAMPPSHLSDGAQIYFLPTVARAALIAYETARNDPVDAPIHALRLARGVVAASTGCWRDMGLNPPLSADHLDRLVQLYWER